MHETMQEVARRLERLNAVDLAKRCRRAAGLSVVNEAREVIAALDFAQRAAHGAYLIVERRNADGKTAPEAHGLLMHALDLASIRALCEEAIAEATPRAADTERELAQDGAA